MLEDKTYLVAQILEGGQANPPRVKHEPSFRYIDNKIVYVEEGEAYVMYDKKILIKMLLHRRFYGHENINS